jgi:predicted DNA-binding ribbon-helix-helix protein
MLVESDSLKRRTRSTTYRLPEDMLQDLDAVAKQEEVTQNALVKQILDSYLRWEVSGFLLAMGS